MSARPHLFPCLVWSGGLEEWTSGIAIGLHGEPLQCIRLTAPVSKLSKCWQNKGGSKKRRQSWRHPSRQFAVQHLQDVDADIADAADSDDSDDDCDNDCIDDCIDDCVDDCVDDCIDEAPEKLYRS